MLPARVPKPKPLKLHFALSSDVYTLQYIPHATILLERARTLS